MQRVLINTPVSLSVAVDVDGVATNPSPDSATVTVRRDDGTAIVTAVPATDSGTGSFGYVLTAAQNPQLDVLTATWTTSLGIFETTTEVVGGFLFTIAQARALKPLDDTVKYSAQAIIDARTLAETALEDACGVAFVPRYKRETVSGSGSRELLLTQPRVTAIRSVSLDDAAQTAADYVPSGPGVLYTANGWTRGFGNYEVVYEHGWPEAPPRVSEAARALAKHYLVDKPVSDRATSMTTDDGTTQFLVTAGVRQAAFSLPECNAVVDQYRHDGVRGVDGVQHHSSQSFRVLYVRLWSADGDHRT